MPGVRSWKAKAPLGSVMLANFCTGSRRSPRHAGAGDPSASTTLASRSSTTTPANGFPTASRSNPCQEAKGDCPKAAKRLAKPQAQANTRIKIRACIPCGIIPGLTRDVDGVGAIFMIALHFVFIRDSCALTNLGPSSTVSSFLDEGVAARAGGTRRPKTILSRRADPPGRPLPHRE